MYPVLEFSISANLRSYSSFIVCWSRMSLYSSISDSVIRRWHLISIGKESEAQILTFK